MPSDDDPEDYAVESKLRRISLLEDPDSPLTKSNSAVVKGGDKNKQNIVRRFSPGSSGYQDTLEGEGKQELKYVVATDTLVLHCPRAEPFVFEEVDKAGVEKAVFHWYTGPHETLRKISKTEGYYISVTPAIAYSGELQKVVDLTELGDILVESDGPVKYRDLGKGEPSHIPMIIEKIGEIKNIDKSTVEKATTENAQKIFDI